MSRIVFLLIAAIASGAVAILPSLAGIHQKFEFQHSFKPPHVANDKGQIHFWEHGGGEGDSGWSLMSVSWCRFISN